MDKSIYDMSLHEILPIETDPRAELWTSVMRVPGGWIYRSYYRSLNMMSNVFVPFNNEYQETAAVEGD